MRSTLISVFVLLSAQCYSQKSAADWIRLGYDQDESGEYQSAIQSYSKAIQIQPSHTAYYNRGVAKRKLSLHKEAIVDFTKAIDMDPSNSIGYFARGNSRDDLGLYEDAIADFTKVIQLNPADKGAYYNRGLVKRHLGKNEEAIEDYTKALQFDPNDASAYHNRGYAQDELGNYKEAIDDYSKAIQLNPSHRKAYFNRAIARRNLDQYQEAISDDTKAIQLDPSDPTGYNNRGYSYEQVGDLAAALKDYQTAVRIDPKYNLALNNLERVTKLLNGTSAPSSVKQSRVWVVSIGITSYQRDYILTGLGSPERSAYEIARYFERQGFTDNREIPVLSGPGANKDAILALLKQEFLNDEVRSDDMIIFYFSGHGVMVDNKIGICPYDYYDASSIITDQDILDIVEKSTARHKVCFIESCKSEVKAMSVLSAESKQKFHQERNQIGSGLIYITSTLPGERSIEDPKIGGIFSYYLLNGLRGAANKNNDKFISTKELFDYIKEGVVQKTNGFQVPQINQVGYALDIPIMVID